jgi:hypothetical protein
MIREVGGRITLNWNKGNYPVGTGWGKPISGQIVSIISEGVYLFRSDFGTEMRVEESDIEVECEVKIYEHYGGIVINDKALEQFDKKMKDGTA